MDTTVCWWAPALGAALAALTQAPGSLQQPPTPTAIPAGAQPETQL